MQVTVERVERLRNSVNGNPRFRLHTDRGEYTISSDSACAYDVENVTGQLPVTVELELTKAGRFYSIQAV